MMTSRGMGAISPAKMPTRKAKGGWIKDAIKKPGALHEQMGIPEGESIPKGELGKAAQAPGKLGQRARLAETLRGLK